MCYLQNKDKNGARIYLFKVNDKNRRTMFHKSAQS